MAMKRDASKLGRVDVEPEVRERRGERVLISISIQVRGLREDNTKVDEGAEAIVVSRFGALLRMDSLLKMGSALTVTNSLSKEEEVFRVAWIGERRPDGRWDIGVEAANPREDFWGIRFPAQKRKI